MQKDQQPLEIEERHLPYSDAPLQHLSEDQFGRDKIAKRIAENIIQLDAQHGFVLGLQGSWGSGKTTLANFIVEHLDNYPEEERPIIVRFNPWWFADERDLLVNFFAQMSARFKRSDIPKTMGGVGEALGTLAIIFSITQTASPNAALLAPAIPIIAKVGSLLIGLNKKHKQPDDLEATKAQIVDSLRKSKRKVVVVIDDLDRLDSARLKQVFAITKSIADFPNIVYIVLFDRERTAKLLADSKEDGAAYLEKVIQTTIEVPDLTPLQLHKLLIQQIKELVKHIDNRSEDADRLRRLLADCLFKRLSTPRDIKRYGNAITFTFPAVKNEVNVIDYLTLEFIRLFFPVVYNHVRSNPALYTGSSEVNILSEPYIPKDKEIRKAMYEDVLKTQPDLVRICLKILFPRMACCYDNYGYGIVWRTNWVQAKRACIPAFFPAYSTMTIPMGFFGDADYQRLLVTTSNYDDCKNALLRLAEEHYVDGKCTRLYAALNILLGYGSEFKPLDPAITARALFDIVEGVEQFIDDPLSKQLNYVDQVCCLVTRIAEQSPQPARFVENIINSAASLYTTCFWLSRYIDRSNNDGKQYRVGNVSLSEAEMNTIRCAALGRLNEAASSGALTTHPEAMFLLYRWYQWNPEEALQFIANMIESDAGLITFLNQAFSDFEDREVFGHESIQFLKEHHGTLQKMVDWTAIPERAKTILNSDRVMNSEERKAIRIAAAWNDTEETLQKAPQLFVISRKELPDTTWQ